MPTHKKAHDKDKYYYLAKDQGYRSRASYKLIQINKRYDFLRNAKVCIDLCAAPGGWCQVAEKNMSPGSIIIGVDLLPIRPIRNVKTIVNDITTAECRKLLQAELQGWQADVVLCDGAPNIGSAYSKDAYVQNELVIAALKTATDHLVEGGTFCTKVYRSVDYNAIVWVLQQLFEDVQTMKPNSSRSQSSEIFLVCLKYTAPKHIDPKLLDPNFVFKEVKDPGLKKVDVLHKKYEKSNKRHRTGYDESLGILLSQSVTVTDFLNSTDPVQILTDASELVFTEVCQKYARHDSTTPELLLCFQDLRVLGKIDFKKILKWRQGIRTAFELCRKSETASRVEKAPKRILTEDEEIAEELEKLQSESDRKKRREKKQSRETKSKARRKLETGMANNAFEQEQDMELFSAVGIDSILKKNPSKPAHEKDYNNNNINTVVDGDDEDNDDVDWAEGEQNEIVIDDDDDDGNDDAEDDDELDEFAQLEEQLDYDYKRFVAKRRSRKAQEMADSADRAKYDDPELEMELDLGLNGSRHSSRNVVNDENYFEEDEVELSAGDFIDHDNTNSKSRIRQSKKNLKTDSKEIALKQSSEWFSNPIFKDAELTLPLQSEEDANVVDSNHNGDELGCHQRDPPLVAHRKNKRKSETDLNKKGSEDVDIEMPKTDKQLRKEKRKKQLDRSLRQQGRRAAREAPTEDEEGLNRDGTGPGDGKGISGLMSGETEEDERVLTEHDLKRLRLLERGMGSQTRAISKISEALGFEIVSRDSSDAMGQFNPSFEDDLSSGNALNIDIDGNPVEEEIRETDLAEEYLARGANNKLASTKKLTAQNRVTTLALGTLMLNPSRKKAIVDASYNRYSWNEDTDELPSWFVEDENRHNKPQVPVPAALIDQIKGRFKITGTKEIKKVAEARARKRKRVMGKLKAAKSKANAMAENTDMSQREKMKAISRAMREAKITKPGKVYVITRKSGGGSVGTKSSDGKGKLKFVDKRLRKDKRAEKANKKRGKK